MLESGKYSCDQEHTIIIVPNSSVWIYILITRKQFHSLKMWSLAMLIYVLELLKARCGASPHTYLSPSCHVLQHRFYIIHPRIEIGYYRHWWRKSEAPGNWQTNYFGNLQRISSYAKPCRSHSYLCQAAKAFCWNQNLLIVKWFWLLIISNMSLTSHFGLWLHLLVQKVCSLRHTSTFLIGPKST